MTIVDINRTNSNITITILKLLDLSSYTDIYLHSIVDICILKRNEFGFTNSTAKALEIFMCNFKKIIP